uniref:NACHT domain-containing protein n=1 Tax=Strigamia maritima TaxID=126957 RepID=T1IVX3_STRMM
MDNDKYCGSGNVPINIEGAKHVPVNIQTNVNNITLDAAKATPETRTDSRQKKSSWFQRFFPFLPSHRALKEKLQQLYRNLTLPKVAWLDEGYDLPMLYFVNLQLNQSNESIDMQDIFKRIKSGVPLRILIEGQPGFGKTTMATKLAYDWARNEKYMNHFKLVFFMPLRELHQQSIARAIEEIGNYCGYQDSDIVQIVNEHMRDTLFILDGLDEVPLEDRHEVIKILYKKIYGDATVAVFCRTGVFEFRKNERTQLSGLPNVSQIFCDKQISILGIKSLRDKQEFLKKFISEQTVKNVIEHLSHQLELFDSPLFLMLLPVILEDNENIAKFQTKAEFYKKLFNSIIKHSYAKREKEIASDFDLFRFNLKLNSIQEQIRDFGILSAHKILRNELKFECSELTNDVYELGFLIIYKQLKCFKSTHYYQALHMSIIEFAIAFSFWIDIKINKHTFKADDLLIPIVHHFLDTNGTSLIMPFLANLMHDELDYLLCQIDSCSAWFSLYFQYTVTLLSECSLSNISECKYLKNFIPSKLSPENLRNNNLKNIQRKLLKYGNECEKIEKITLDFYTFKSEMLTDEMMTCLCLELKVYVDSEPKLNYESVLEMSGAYFNVSALEMSGAYFNIFPNSNCTLQNIISYKKSLNGLVNQCLDLAALPTVESCSAKIYTSSSAAKFVQMISKKKIFSKIKFSYLRIEITTETEKNGLQKLLENNQVQFLHLIVSSELDMHDFFCTAAQSSYLTCLHLSCNTGTVDLFDLTNGGKKKYTYMHLKTCTLTSRHPTSYKNCFNFLKIKSLNDLQTITEVEPANLDCCAMEMKDFCLYINQRYDMFKNIDSTLKNMHTLIIKIKEESGNMEILAKGILKLSIVELIIDGRCTKTNNLFKCINNLRIKEINSCLTTISCLHFWSDMSSELSELIKGLKCNHWTKLMTVSEILIWNLKWKDLILSSIYNGISKNVVFCFTHSKET